MSSSPSPSPAAEAPSAEEEADVGAVVEAEIEMEIDAGGGDDGAEGTSAEAGNDYEEERKSPNEWGDAEDAAIRAAVAAAAGGSVAAASGGAEDDDDSSDGGDGSIDEAGVDKSPNEWGAAEDRAIDAAVAAAAASKPSAAADADGEGDGDGDGPPGWEASAAESLAEHPAIELLSEVDDDEDEEGGYPDDDESSPPEPMPEPRPPPPPRVQYALETPTTEAQRETEEECAPFFVDLRTLPGEQVLHLRAVGLLPPERVPAGGKAARVLGGENNEEEEEEDGGPERADGPSSSSSSEERGDLDAATSIRLLRGRHAAYLTRALTQPLSRGFVALDASRPWIVYWTLHSLDLLDALPYEDVLRNVVSTLDKCWEELEVELDAEEVRTDAILSKYAEDGAGGDEGETKVKVKVPAGGFGGGPGQMAHCAPSYAAVLALCIVYGAGCAYDETPESARAALELLRAKRERLYAWYLSLRRPLPSLSAPPPSSSSSSLEEEKGEPAMVGYRMHHDGEVDVRATYTMLAVTELLHITTPRITDGAAAYVSACQTYEGGFGGEPHSEAHGGYTFCAVAALRLLLGPDARAAMDAHALAGWLARRQMAYEGGFQGRSNKLVDGCYSFWQGGGAAVLDVCNDPRLSSDPHASGVGLGDDDGADDGGLSFDRLMLQRYVLLCAQDVNGGLRDKPSKPRDFYHSCYNLSGLSVAQHVLAPGCGGGGGGGGAEQQSGAAVVWGDREKNEVGATHPVFNVRVEKVEAALAEFGGSAAAGRPR